MKGKKLKTTTLRRTGLFARLFLVLLSFMLTTNGFLVPVRAENNSIAVTVSSANPTGMLSGDRAELFLNIRGYSDWVAAIPVPDPDLGGTFDKNALLAALSTTDYYIDDSYISTGLPAGFGDLSGQKNYLLIYGKPASTHIVFLYYTYPNGTTPDDTSLTVKPYIFNATFNGSASSVIPVTSGGSVYEGNSVTLQWNTNEDLSLVKSLSPTTPAFTDLVGRPYNDVILQDNEDNYVVTYTVSLSTNGSGNKGRIFMDVVKISDTLSGYSKKPTLIEIKNGDTLVASSASDFTIGNTSTTFEFSVPLTNNMVTNQNFTVNVTFDKDDYTKMLTDTSSYPLAEINNEAKLYYKPVTASSGSWLNGNSVSTKFGWKQLEPTLPSLTITKNISVSGQPDQAYNTTLASAYEKAYDATPYATGDASNVKFTLTKIKDASGNTVNVPLEKSLILNSSGSSLTFGDAGDFGKATAGLEPGTYTLVESQKISGYFQTVATHEIKVTQPENGVSKMYIDNVEGYTLPITNIADTTGRIQVHVSQQKEFEVAQNGDPLYENTSGAKFKLMDGSTVIGYGTSDVNGNIIFENVPLGKTYTLQQDYDLGYYDTDNTMPKLILDTAKSDLTGIASSNSTVNKFEVYYKRNEGSIYTGKQFASSMYTGGLVPNAIIGNFKATFHLESADGVVVPGSTFVINGQANAVALITDANNQKVGIYPGTYHIVEEELVIGGQTYTPSSTNAPYTFIKYSDNVTVVIEAGKWNSKPIGASNFVSSEGLLIDTTTWGELAIDSKLMGPLDDIQTNAYGFTIEAKTGALMGQTIAVLPNNGWSDGIYKILLPAGTYEVAPTNQPANMTTVASMGTDASQGTGNVTVVVTGSVPSDVKDNVTVNNSTPPYNTSIAYNGSKQTAVFVQAYLPSVSFIKERSDTSGMLAGAKFALYKVEGSNYVLVKDSSNNPVIATSTGSSTNVTFTNVKIGEYIAVEYDVPSGYIAQTNPASVFAPAGTLLDSVAISSVSQAIKDNLPSFTITQKDYYHEAAYPATKTDGINGAVTHSTLKNAPIYIAKVKAVDAATGADITSAAFNLYEDGALIGTATINAGGYFVFKDNSNADIQLQFNKTYKVVQTATNSGADYVLPGEEITFTITGDGVPSSSADWSLGSDTKDDATAGIIKNSQYIIDSTNRVINIKMGNLKKPTITFKKQGQTNFYNNDVRRIDDISGGTFSIYYLNGATKIYIYTGTAQTNPLGVLDINQTFDPSKTYYLEETTAPVYQPEGELTPLAYLKVDDIPFTFVLNADKSAYIAKIEDSVADVSKYGEGQYNILNRIEPYYIHIVKLPVRPVGDDGGTGLDSGKPNATPCASTTDPTCKIDMTVDFKNQAEKDAGWEELGVYDTEFEIYQAIQYSDNSEWGPKTSDGTSTGTVLAPVQTISTGTYGMDPKNDAKSSQLPFGDYWIVESKPGLNYGELGSWSGLKCETNTANCPNEYNEQSTVYVHDNPYANYNGSGKREIDSVLDDTWTAVTPTNEQYGYLLHLTQVTTDVNNDGKIDDDDRTADIIFGDSNRLDTGRGEGSETYIKLWAYKIGASRLPNGLLELYHHADDATNQYDGKLEDVTFYIYPAIYDGMGDLDDPASYIELPTIGGTAIATVTSKKDSPMITSFINASAVFNSGSFSGSTFTPNATGVDWAAVIADPSYGINELKAKELMLSANHATTGSTPGYAFIWKEDMSTVPEAFGKTATQTLVTVHGSYVNSGIGGFFNEWDDQGNKTYYGTMTYEGRSISITPEIDNTRGYGTLQIKKTDFANSATVIPGATFEIYQVDPAWVETQYSATDSKTWNGLAAVKADALDHLLATPVSIDGVSQFTTNASGIITVTLEPGYYVLKEVAGATGYNIFGTYTIDYPDGHYNGDNSRPHLPADESTAVSYASGAKFALIEISDYQNGNFVINVTNKQQPDIKVKNWWNGVEMYEDTFATNYDLVALSKAYNDYAVINAVAKQFDNLPDGEYTLSMDALSNATTALLADNYVGNPNVLGGKVVVTVADATITSIKVDGVEILPNPVNSTAKNADIWLTVDPDTGIITINVNHASQGALIIRKGGINSMGTKVNYTSSGATQVPSTLTSATFTLYKSFDGGQTWSLATSEGVNGVITWNSATDANIGVRENLPPGLYKVVETSVSSNSDWSIDATPVYFEITNDGGAVYLTNHDFIGGTDENDADHPLVSSKDVDVQYFYNTSKEGTYGIWKLASKDGGTSDILDGAVFLIYPVASASVTSITTEKPFAIVEADRTIYYYGSEDIVTYCATYDEHGPVTPPSDCIIENNTGVKYRFHATGGTYIYKEITAPSGYALRSDEVNVTVVAGVGPHYEGFEDPDNVNASGFLNPPVVTLNVKKWAEYPAIEGIPGSVAKDVMIVGMPFVLFVKDTSKANCDIDSDHLLSDYSAACYDQVGVAQVTWLGASDATHTTGVAKFVIDQEGEYRILEYIGAGLEYLGLNENFCALDADTCSSASIKDDDYLGKNSYATITAVYDPDTNTMVLSGTNSSLSTWTADSNLLEVKNPFNGYQIAVEKKDFYTGELVKGATFALYQQKVDGAGQPVYKDAANTIPDCETTPALIQVPSIDNNGNVNTTAKTQLITDGATTAVSGASADGTADGYVYFDPFYLNVSESRTYCVAETQAPYGYVIDDWFSTNVQYITISGSDEEKSAVLTFVDGQPGDPKLTPDKSVADVSGTVLRESDISATYTIDPQTVNGDGSANPVITNGLPIFNYTISDPGFSFSGMVGNTETLIPSSAANHPTYAINYITIGKSEAYASAQAQKDGSYSAVWARVIVTNGAETQELAWKKLDGSQTWNLSNLTDTSSQPFKVTGFTIEYSSMDPANATATDAYGNVFDEDSLWVGSQFKPGSVTYGVTFNKFSPTASQPEVTIIKNTATITGVHNEKDLKGEDTVKLELNAPKRPLMGVSKTLDAIYYSSSSPLTLDSETPKDPGLLPEPNDYIAYTSTLTNVATADNLDLAYPIMIDVMEEDAMSLKFYILTLPDGSVFDSRSNPWVNFENNNDTYLVWRFPNLTLKPGETITVQTYYQLNTIVPRSSITNEIYGTSGTPLSFSATYPTGASFEAAIEDYTGTYVKNMIDPNAVYVGADANTWYGKTGTTPAQSQAYYDKLAAFGEDFPLEAGYDLFVRAAVENEPIMASSSMAIQKSQQVYHEDTGELTTWRLDNDPTPQEIYFGDTVTYRLRMQTPKFDTKGVVIYDLLPASGDVRGTSWNASLLDYYKLSGEYTITVNDPAQGISTLVYDGTSVVSFTNNISGFQIEDVVVSSATAGVSVYNDMLTAAYTTGLDPDAQAVKFDFGTTLFKENTLISIEYKVKLNAPATADAPALLAANARKEAINNISVSYTMNIPVAELDPDTNDYYHEVSVDMYASPKNVHLILIPGDDVISGLVWEDMDADGFSTTADNGTDPWDKPMENVTVKLHKYIDAVEVFPDKADPSDPDPDAWDSTFTDANGLYYFYGQQSSYGTPYGTSGQPGYIGEVTYRIEVVKPTDANYGFTYTNATPADPEHDSDIYQTPVGGKYYSELFALKSGHVVDAGLVQTVSISGSIFRDFNDDGYKGDAFPSYPSDTSLLWGACLANYTPGLSLLDTACGTTVTVSLWRYDASVGDYVKVVADPAPSPFGISLFATPVPVEKKVPFLEINTGIAALGFGISSITQQPGSYTFDNLLPGIYQVRFDRTDLSSPYEEYVWAITDTLSGTATGYDSKADPDASDVESLKAATLDITLKYSAGDTGMVLKGVSDVDAGLVPELYHLSGMVWNDLNKNGIKDDGSYPVGYDYDNRIAAVENPISGVLVSLYMSSDGGATYTKIADATTRIDGSYSFYGDWDSDDPGSPSVGLPEPNASLMYKVEFAKPNAKFEFSPQDVNKASLGDPTYNSPLATLNADLIDSDVDSSGVRIVGYASDGILLRASVVPGFEHADAGMYRRPDDPASINTAYGAEYATWIFMMAAAALFGVMRVKRKKEE
jgi:hypothetical protein